MISCVTGIYFTEFHGRGIRDRPWEGMVVENLKQRLQINHFVYFTMDFSAWFNAEADNMGDCQGRWDFSEDVSVVFDCTVGFRWCVYCC